MQRLQFLVSWLQTNEVSFTSILQTEVKLISVLETEVNNFLPPATPRPPPWVINFWKNLKNCLLLYPVQPNHISPSRVSLFEISFTVILLFNNF